MRSNSFCSVCWQERKVFSNQGRDFLIEKNFKLQKFKTLKSSTSIEKLWISGGCGSVYSPFKKSDLKTDLSLNCDLWAPKPSSKKKTNQNLCSYGDSSLASLARIRLESSGLLAVELFDLKGILCMAVHPACFQLDDLYDLIKLVCFTKGLAIKRLVWQFKFLPIPIIDIVDEDRYRFLFWLFLFLQALQCKVCKPSLEVISTCPSFVRLSSRSNR